MARSKQSTALFEVYAKATQLDTEPDDGAIRPSPRRKSVSAFRNTLVNLSRALGGDGASAPTDRPSAKGATSVGIDGGMLHVTLTSRGAGIAVFAILLLGFAAFSMGHWAGRSAAVDVEPQTAKADAQRDDAVARALEAEPASGLFEDVGESPIRLTATRPPSRVSNPPAAPSTVESEPGRTVDWQKGMTYIVVQNFGDNARQDAVAAQEHLGERDVDTEIVGGAGRGYRLIATRAFDWSKEKERRAAKEFERKIHRIGRAYYKSGGRYRLQGYVKTLKSDSW